MVDLNEIEAEIAKLENAETTYNNCTRLAVLYSVRDHCQKTKKAAYSYGQSQFLQVVSQAPMERVLEILDEHMEAIEVLHPREYAAIIRKIKEL